MDSFEEAYAQHEALVRGFLRRLCGDDALAEELTQETFYQAMRHWRDFRGQASVSTWLCTIGKRLYYDSCRKKSPTPMAEVPRQGEAPDLAERLVSSDQRLSVFRLLHRSAGALPRGVYPADVRRIEPRGDRQSFREERELVAGNVLPWPAAAAADGGRRGGKA